MMNDSTNVVDRLARTVGLKSGRGRYSRLDLSPSAPVRSKSYLPGSLGKRYTLLVAISSIAFLVVYFLVRLQDIKNKRRYGH
jgi:hypothetical protein